MVLVVRKVGRPALQILVALAVPALLPRMTVVVAAGAVGGSVAAAVGHHRVLRWVEVVGEVAQALLPEPIQS